MNTGRLYTVPMRLAWFSPWPPQRSGVAGRSRELVERLAARGYAIDVFVHETVAPVDRAGDADPPRAGAVRVESAHHFVWRVARRQYDLAVYQMGNSGLHAFIWPYLAQWPGLVVLHDSRLHHARGAVLMTGKRHAAYRREFAASHPRLTIDAAELVIAGFDGPFYYDWPMLAGAVEPARLVAVHARGAAREVAASWPDTPVEYVALGEGAAACPSAADREEARVQLGFDRRAVVFGVFGALTRERRVPEILRAFGATLARVPHARLLLAGATTVLLDVRALIAESGVAAAVTLVDTPDDAAFDRMIAAVDVSMNLRWPTARETSGPWLRALAAGRPTVIVDLEHQTHVPTVDPRTWRSHSAAEPASVAIDIVDEEHSLRLAMRRLATDAGFREELGHAGRRYWEAEHTVERMVEDYERVLHRAATLPDPARSAAIPAADPTAHARALVSEVTSRPCELF